MEPELVVVDGPNVFNRVGTLLERALERRHHAMLEPYLTEWFDIDRLVRHALRTVPPKYGVKIVHSRRSLGREPYRLDSAKTHRFWRRQAALSGCRARVVDIKADEMETHEGNCSACGAPVELRTTREKGVDVAVVSELFGAPEWTCAVLVSSDTDFAPALETLGTMGRHVICLGVSRAEPTALHTESAEFREIDAEWLRADFATFQLARRGGGFDEAVARLREKGLVFAFQWLHERELALISRVHRLQLGVVRAPLDHAEVFRLIEPALEACGSPRLVEREERNDFTMLHAVPFGLALDEGIARRMEGAQRPNWCDTILPRGVFELVSAR